MYWWWIYDIYIQYIKNPDVDGVKHGWTRNPLEPEGHLLVGCSGCNHLQSALICCCGLVSIFSCSSKVQDHWTSWRTYNMFPQRLPSVLLLKPPPFFHSSPIRCERTALKRSLCFVFLLSGYYQTIPFFSRRKKKKSCVTKETENPFQHTWSFSVVF